ncbi:MAG: hypothetical protein ABJG47_01310 [Ekhidna sp.]
MVFIRHYLGKRICIQELFCRKEKNLFFYLTPPEQLISDHYPDDLRWSLLDSVTAKSLFYKSPIQSHQPFEYGLINYAPKSKILKLDTLHPFKLVLEFDRQFDLNDISINGWPMESLKDKLNIEVTLENYDSLENSYPNLSLIIPKIEIVEQIVTENRIEFIIQPLSASLKQIGIYMDSGWPSMIYDVEF